MKLRPPALFVACLALYLAYALVGGGGPAGSPEKLFGDFPVLNGGRVKPLDLSLIHICRWAWPAPFFGRSLTRASW